MRQPADRQEQADGRNPLQSVPHAGVRQSGRKSSCRLARFRPARYCVARHRKLERRPHAEIGHDTRSRIGVPGEPGFDSQSTTGIELVIDIGIEIGIEDGFGISHCRLL
jgi:hypothetical protein